MILQTTALQPAATLPLNLPLKRGTIKIEGRTFAVERGVLRVPENRSKVAAREIEIPIVRYCSRSAQPADPIFWFDGGPGMSNLSFKPPARLLDDHDVVLVGYRGADGSSILKCPEIGRALQGVAGDVLSAASRAQLQRAVAQ